MTSSSSLATTTNMVELTTSDVSSAIREIAATIERLDNPNDVELLKLRLDYVSRMLVTIDVPEEIVNTMSSVYENLERVADHTTQYRAQSTSSMGRGRPKTDISREQLEFLVDQGFTAGEMSEVLGVGKRTVQRRLAAFDLSISGIV